MNFLLAFLFAVQGLECSSLTPAEMQIVEQTNAARAEAGLPLLVVDCRLMTSCRRHASRMAGDRLMFHSAGVTENVAVGQHRAGDAVLSWLRSPGHRRNIMGSGYRRIGVAGVVGTDGKTYWVQQFAP